MLKQGFHTKVKERPEWDFVKLFMCNWVQICKDKSLNISSFCRVHGVSKPVVYALKAGNHKRLIYLAYYAHLASLHNLTILDVLNYKAKE